MCIEVHGQGATRLGAIWISAEHLRDRLLRVRAQVAAITLESNQLFICKTYRFAFQHFANVVQKLFAWTERAFKNATKSMLFITLNQELPQKCR
jgi:hypothetical protein